jgi:DNA-binding HxlR family transcriptional regulator
LSLLSDPLDIRVLRELEQAPPPFGALHSAVGSPSETTLRKHLQNLASTGILTRSTQPGFPGSVSHELNSPGRDLLAVVGSLSAWLAAAPTGALRPGTAQAKNAIRALVAGWSTKILRALAARPLSLIELDGLLSDVNYPALQRRITAMRVAGQIAPAPTRTARTAYRPTRWLRQAIRPLAAAANWERLHAADRCEPLTRLDIEALFLLAAPLLTLPSGMGGSCRLAAELASGRDRSLAGIVVALEGGRTVSCTSDLAAAATSAAVAPAATWLAVLAGVAIGDLEFGGNRAFAAAAVAKLRGDSQS